VKEISSKTNPIEFGSKKGHSYFYHPGKFEITYSPTQGMFEDDVPFPAGGMCYLKGGSVRPHVLNSSSRIT